MFCPHCSFDNIAGVDDCESCGQPLVEFDHVGSDLEQAITSQSIGVLNPKQPLTVQASMAVRGAVAEMVARKIGCLLVEEGKQLVGIFTERDVLNKIRVDKDDQNRPVSDFMTPSPATITKDDSIAYALHAMDLGGYRHMAIVDETGRSTGIISVRDILRYLYEQFGEVSAQTG